MGQLACLLVVARELQLAPGALDVLAHSLGVRQTQARLVARQDARGPEHDDRVADAQLLEARLGLDVLREDAQAARAWLWRKASFWYALTARKRRSSMVFDSVGVVVQGNRIAA
jgi:hypothetical protein